MDPVERVEPRVLLVSMPWASLSYPSIALGLLQAGLRRDGVHCDAWYAGYDLAAHMGHHTYEAVASYLPNHLMLGEWLFARCLWQTEDERDRLRTDAEVLASVEPELGPPQGYWPTLLRAREAVEAWFDDAVGRHDPGDYDLVGFTSTFQQNVASLALSRRWKVASPSTVLAFGGANWEAEAGVAQLEVFDWVDAASLGESDHTVVALARGAAEGCLDGVPGIAWRDPDGVVHRTVEEPPVDDLDALPVPDYDDWHAQLRGTGLDAEVQPHICMETSRGCWWGARSHCTFCGLNGGGMTYRSKSPDRAVSELHELRERYGYRQIEMVDNILDTRYFHTVLPRLAEERAAGDPGFEFFYEIKASLTHGQLRAMAAAGCATVQPGIESLSDHVLSLMRKGTTALGNVQVLRWMLELGIEPDWNILYGFPGETAEDYEAMADLMESVLFLTPPVSVGPARVDRFSPFFEDPDAFGLVDLAPFDPYRNVYPFDDEVLAGFAYYFTHAYDDGRDPEAYTGRVRALAARWRAEGDGGGVRMRADDDGSVTVIDERASTGRSRRLRWTGWRAELYLACDRARALDELDEVRALDGLDPLDRQRFLDWCVRERLLVHDGDRYLGVAVHTPARTSADHPGLRHHRRFEAAARAVPGIGRTGALRIGTA